MTSDDLIAQLQWLRTWRSMPQHAPRTAAFFRQEGELSGLNLAIQIADGTFDWSVVPGTDEWRARREQNQDTPPDGVRLPEHTPHGGE